MPIDLAMPLYLSQEEFSFRKTSKACHPGLNSSLRFEQPNHSDCNMVSADGGSVKKSNKKLKKRVSFADHKGLALTKVKVFSEFTDPIDIPLNIQEMLTAVSKPTEEKDKLVLDFTQPSCDYLLFRQRLESDNVCLEYCVLKEKALAGTVKVKNLSFEKSVKVRVTFDTWKSYKDIDCQFVKDTYPGSDRDTFSFELSLPDQLRPHEHIEFAISYEANSCMYWDSNQGQNYRIVWSSMKNTNQQRCPFDMGIHFDRYGSPTCSHGIFPEWPSYAGYENIGPYY